VAVADAGDDDRATGPRPVRGLRTPPWVRRSPANPVLTADDVPYPASLVFNPAVAKVGGRYLMVFRNDVAEAPGVPRFVETNLGLAHSDDGVSWTVAPQPCLSLRTDEIVRVYDPRLTVLEGRAYLTIAVETRHGLRGGILATEDFERFETVDLTVPDNRNLALFPERVEGRYLRLERPFPVYGRGGEHRFDVWLSRSPDLIHWGEARLLLAVEDVPFANAKIGPGPPPIRTEHGWLALFHAVDVGPARGRNGWEPSWRKRYTAGAMLLDLDDPGRVLGVAREPILVPEAPYETEGGFRNDVVFVSGAVLEPDGEVTLYYGAADHVVALASARLDDLLAACVAPD
jgi:beta-1,4-mannooligosaccharide/beta-1,4-mannosyl-N-acetylglucosamine phosphorylase